MAPQQILMWANELLKPFSLQIRAREKVYRLELQSELMSLIARKNKNGKVYKDSRNLLNQEVRKEEAEDLFGDDFRAQKALHRSEAPAGTFLFLFMVFALLSTGARSKTRTSLEDGFGLTS